MNCWHSCKFCTHISQSSNFSIVSKTIYLILPRISRSNVFKYHVSCTDGKTSVRIKIGITFIFRFHRRPIQLVVFIPIGLSYLLRHRRQILLGVKVPSVAWPEQLTVGVQITDWGEISLHWVVFSCDDIIEQVLGGGCL